MIVWTRLGILVLVIGFLSFLTTEFVIEYLNGDSSYYQSHGWPKAVGGLIGGAAIWIVGYFLNTTTKKRILVDPQTGERLLFESGGGHTFFFVPMQYWGPVVFGAGLVLALANSQAPPVSQARANAEPQRQSQAESQRQSQAEPQRQPRLPSPIATVSKPAIDERPSNSAQSFWVDLPIGRNWQQVADGKPNPDLDIYTLAVENIARGFRLSVIVMPSPAEAPTLALAKDSWERGFSKKMKRKISARDTVINGQPAYMVTGELAGSAKPSEIIGCLMVAKGKNFILGIIKQGENISSDPEAQAFINSFTIR